jgi:hypothetical protein
MTDRTVPTGPMPGNCTRCGFPWKEHTYNGACYGICGQFVAASPAAPGAEVEPVAWIPASQIDELRELAGGIDLEYWSTKVIHAYVLPAEGRIPVYLSPPTTDAIRAQARREALEEAAKEMDRRRDDATGICSPRVTYSNAARAIRALADKGEAE